VELRAEHVARLVGDDGGEVDAVVRGCNDRVRVVGSA